MLGGKPMVRGTVTGALGHGVATGTVPSQGMSPQDVELSPYDHTAAADSVSGPSMQLRCASSFLVLLLMIIIK